MLDTNPATPCKRCGSLERNAKRECRPCAIARSAAWRKSNAERAKETAAAWREKNRDHLNEYSASKRAEHPEKYRAMVKAWDTANKSKRSQDNARWYLENVERKRIQGRAWRAENPEAKKVIDQNRRARKKSGGNLSRDIIKKLLQLQKGLCPCCKKPLGEDFHLDHIIPLAKGGTNTDDNVQLLRRLCNSQKSTKDPVEFMQSRGFLL